MGYPLKKILASLPPGLRPSPHFHRRGGASAYYAYQIELPSMKTYDVTRDASMCIYK